MKFYIKLLLISYISLAIAGCSNPYGGDGPCDAECMAAFNASQVSEDNPKRVSDISFIDVNLSICLSDLELNTDTIVSSITSLDCSEMSIVDLSGIEELTELNTLLLHTNQISDISPLANLTALTKLWLHNNQISDISPVTNLTALTELWSSANQINDVSPLSNLIALTGLGLHTNQIGDIAPLANLTALTELWLYNNQISDISTILNWTNLPSDSLYINENPVDCTQSESLDSRAISEVENYGSAATTCINP